MEQLDIHGHNGDEDGKEDVGGFVLVHAELHFEQQPELTRGRGE